MASLVADFIDLDKNYSLFSIPVAVVLGFLPAAYGRATAWHARAFNNASPRDYKNNISATQKLDQKTKKFLFRCESTTENALETLPLFATAVLAANVVSSGGNSTLTPQTLNLYAGGYLASRAAYNVLYMWLQGWDKRFAPVRSVAWLGGIVCWMTLFVKAGYGFLEASSRK